MTLVDFDDVFDRPLALAADICLVGSAPTLLSAKCGAQIDAHATVIRFNRAATKGFEDFAGERTTVRFIGENIVAEHADALKAVFRGEHIVSHAKNCPVLDTVFPDDSPYYVSDYRSRTKRALRILSKICGLDIPAQSHPPRSGIVALSLLLPKLMSNTRETKGPLISLYGFEIHNSLDETGKLHYFSKGGGTRKARDPSVPRRTFHVDAEIEWSVLARLRDLNLIRIT